VVWSWKQVAWEGTPFYAWGYTDLDGSFCWGLDNPAVNREQFNKAVAAKAKTATPKAKAKEVPKPAAPALAPVVGSMSGDTKTSHSIQPIAEDVSKGPAVAAMGSPAPSAPSATIVKLNNGTDGYDYGVNPFKIHESAQKASDYYYTNASDDEAKPSKELHLTVIGPKADRAQVMSDLASNAALKAAASRAWVQEYEPGDWEIDPALKFPTGGNPDILIQSADGAVLWRTSSYQDVGPEGLTEALRKADPNYDPSRDPQPGNDGGPSLPWFSKEVWIGVVAVALLILLPSRSDPQ
jgi:hypothetical protein